jgi:DedD protein
MDRRFKERLIGAVVLAVVAVLILPAVLNGPHAPLPEPAGPGEATMRTETIELEPGSRFAEAAAPPATAQPPAAEATDARPPAAAAPDTPMPDVTERTPSAERVREGASAPATRATAAPPASDTTPRTPAPEEAPRVASAAKPSAPPAKSTAPPAAPGAGWAVQVGTFASASNATALAASLKTRGYAAFVAPMASGDKTLYRVRVGPMPDVESARALEQRLEKEMPAAVVVRQP